MSAAKTFVHRPMPPAGCFQRSGSTIHSQMTETALLKGFFRARFQIISLRLSAFGQIVLGPALAPEFC
jgi:hypothetical protein